MAVELRELIIRTEITSKPEQGARLNEEDMKTLKQQIINETLRSLKQQTRQARFER